MTVDAPTGPYQRRAATKAHRDRLVCQMQALLAQANDPHPRSGDGLFLTPHQAWFRRKAIGSQIARLRGEIAAVNAELRLLPPDAPVQAPRPAGNFRKPFGQLYGWVEKLEARGRITFTDEEARFLAKMSAYFDMPPVEAGEAQ